MRKWTPLDVLFVLFSSLTVSLLIFWLASQLLGDEILNELPPWLNTIGSKFWSFLVTGSAATLTQFLNKNREDSPNYMVWIVFMTVFFMGSTLVIYTVLDSDEEYQESFEAKMYLSLPSVKDNQNLTYLQQAPQWVDWKNRARQNDGLFELDVILPKTNNTFIIKLAPQIIESTFTNRSNTTELCLQRASVCEGPHQMGIKYSNNRPIITRVGENDCSISLCEGQTAHLDEFQIIKANAFQDRYFWNVPTLEYLEKSGRRGYAHFKVTVEQTADLDFDYFTYRVIVNGNEVLFNGISSDDLRHAKGESDISLDFGLESLNFNGQDNGVEHVDITVSLHKNGNISQSIEVPLEYVAFRTFRKRTITYGNNTVTWESKYYAPEDAAHELIVVSGTNLAGLVLDKEKIDEANLEYDGKRVIGVIRPPLGENLNYGLIVGLELPNKQTLIDFSRNEVERLKQWVLEPEHVNYFKQDAYIYRLNRAN
ncbi:hypothetical protein [Roseivirga misakiensis]|uniref:Uncharacterized protein n=1 Tax=Roseivirga misakiensis TaxID=1563681 RepID=A0A1E5T553_9BACT|nr:hypothetical protein [Roseivirga misakiensis]OEK06486.1 hypothetical protein BFP71_02075 [Roseivirga misakiensis]